MQSQKLHRILTTLLPKILRSGVALAGQRLVLLRAVSCNACCYPYLRLDFLQLSRWRRSEALLACSTFFVLYAVRCVAFPQLCVILSVSVPLRCSTSRKTPLLAHIEEKGEKKEKKKTVGGNLAPPMIQCNVQTYSLGRLIRLSRGFGAGL